MNLVNRFYEYAAEFERSYKTDDWSRLGTYFTPDSIYVIADGTEISGREQIVNYLRKDVQSFDRQFDSRRLELSHVQEIEGAVRLKWEQTLVKSELPVLVVVGEEIAEFEGDKIRILRDIVAPEMQTQLEEWLKTHFDK